MYYEASNDPLSRAANFVNQATDVDNNFLDLATLLGIDTFNEPTIGGCEPNEYPILNFQTPELAPLKMKVLPLELQERLKNLQCSCQMGVFTEINRAWLSIDNDIYLWTYDDGTDIAYYDRLHEVVLSAALIHPKPNIFQSHISHLLCIATPVEVVLLGVTFSSSCSNTGTGSSSPPSFNDLYIIPDPLYAVATDNVHMTSIISTPGGRIFMAGKDGCLYELEYQGDLGWFGKRSCRKINHSTSFSSYILPSIMTSYFSEEDPLVQLCFEESRMLLFARSQRSNLQVSFLGRDGTKFNKIAYVNHDKILKRINKNFDKSQLSPIVHISCVPACDSERIHLVAVTSSGARLYYTTRGYSDVPQHPSLPPNCLTLLHIRLPPYLGNPMSPQRVSSPYASSFPSHQLVDVHVAAYSHGTYLISASNPNDDGDALWTVSSDTFPFANMLSESQELTQLAGKVWGIEVIETQTNQMTELVHSPLVIGDSNSGALNSQGTDKTLTSLVLPDPPAIVTQHYSANKKFAIVSSVGVCIAVKLSPCEQLQHLLLKHAVDSEPIRSYFRLLKEQAMTSCLALMASKSASHLQVNNLATRAYTMYKWDQNVPNFGQTLSIAEQTSTPMPGQIRRHLNFQHISPLQQQQHQQTSFVVDLSCSSLSHKSLYLYLARILRPVWFHKVVTQVPHQESGTVFMTSRLSSDQINIVLQKCQDLKVLLQNNPSLLVNIPVASPGTHPGVSAIIPDNFSVPRNMSARSIEMETDEAISLRNLELLLDMCCQCLSMWKILADHQFHVIASRLKKDEQDIMSLITFYQLLVSGRNLCKQLVNTLVDFYIDDNAATDAVSSRLREFCPLLYSTQDQAQTKGNECLKQAKTSNNPLERRKLIDTAIQQYKTTISSSSVSPASIHQQVGSNCTTTDLPSMCSRLASVGSYTGLVDLVLTSASKRDPNALAQHYYLRSKPPEDREGARFYALRTDCYKSILESLDYLMTLCSEAEQQKASEGIGKLIGNTIGGFIAPFFSAAPASNEKKDLVSPLTNGCVMTCDEANEQVEEIIKMIIKSDDQMAHYALFDWMTNKGLSEKLLDLPSPYLEQYLKLESSFDQLRQQLQVQQQPQQLLKQKAMLELLANYYIKEKKFSLAAKILDALAVKPGTHQNLKDRLNYMSRAALCLQSSPSRTDGEFMHEVQDKVEVILLQIEIIKSTEKCNSRPQHEIENAICLLDSQLFDISELYSNFAIPFELSTSKLAIVHSSGHRDTNLIESLWKEIIDKEIESSIGREPLCRMELLSTSFVALGKVYQKTENYFPIAFLAKHLEQTSVRSGFSDLDLTFVARSFFEIGIAIQQLHEAYEKLFRQKDSFWKNLRKTYHLVEVDYYIMCQFLEQTQAKFLSPEKRQMLARCLDGVSFYLVELQSDLNRDVNLVSKLKEIQIRMERLER